MAFGKILRDSRLNYGTLPQNMLDRSPLSPLARLLWGVLDASGTERTNPGARLIAVRMGLKPSSTKTVTKYLAELVDHGFCRIRSGRRWGVPNAYFLTMPDYCFIESDELLKVAVSVPVTPTRGDWTGGKGKSAKRRDRGSFDRLAWHAARRAHNEARRANIPDGPPPGRAKTVGSASPTPLGSASPTPGGQPALPGAAVGPHLVGSDDPTKNEVVTIGSKGEGSTPPPAAAPTTFKSAGTGKDRRGPAGWEGFPGAYTIRHPRRVFVWTSEKIWDMAKEISDLVGADQVPALTKNFLANEYWAKRFHPIEGLRSQLHDFLPETAGPLAGAKVCQHPDKERVRAHSREVRNGQHGDVETVKCGRCLKQLEDIFTPDLPDDDTHGKLSKLIH